MIAHQRQFNADVLVDYRIQLPKPLVDGLHLPARLLDCHAGFESSNGLYRVIPSVGEIDLTQMRQRQPEIGLERILLAHHADNHEARAVELNAFADDSRIIGEAATPERLAENHHSIVNRLFFFWQKVATEYRLKAEQWKQVLRNQHALRLYRLTVAGQLRFSVTFIRKSRHSLKRLRLRAPIQKIRIFAYGAGAANVGLRLPDHDQPIRVSKRQRTYQHSIDNAEDRRIRANAQRQRERCHGREALALEQHSYAVAQVLPDGLERPETPHRSAVLFRQGDATKRTARS